MPTLSQQVALFLRQHCLVGSRLVVAVSGGADSVCLLHILAGLRDELSVSLHVAHLDHALRAESPADAKYVARLAKKLGLTVTVERADVRAYRQRKKLSVEEAAREVRYRFLAGVAKGLGTPYIVTGHTRDDHVETILLHILRGTGIRGLVGLKPLTPWIFEGQKIALVRPLIGVPRPETAAYCRQAGLRPRLDVTNLSLTPLRNRIRLELLPRLKEYNAGVEAALLRLSSAAGEDISYLDDSVSSVWAQVVREDGGVIILIKNALLAQPPAVQACLLRRALETLLGSTKDIEMRHIENVMSSLELPAGRHLDLPYGLAFVVGYDRYWLGRPVDIPAPYPDFTGSYRLDIPGNTLIPGWEINAVFVKEAPQNSNRLVAYFDADSAGTDFTARTWQRGDRFVPLGMQNEKKLGEFMIDEKIPRHWRKNIPLVVSSGRVLWVVGCREDDRAKITRATRQILKIEFKRT